MTNVTQTPVQMPSILSMVQRVKRECGLTEPTTLAGTTDKQSLIVLDALSDATVEIFVRKRWEWRESVYGLVLTAGVSQYPLPADFEQIAQDPKSAGYPIKGQTEEEWQQSVPGLAIVSGQPQIYTVHGSIFEIWPPPNQGYIDQYPILPFSYYRLPPARLDGSDDNANLNLPPDFVECLISFAKWKLKGVLEYPDAQLDFQRYEMALQVQMNVNRAMRRGARMRQTGALRSKIWS